MPFLIESDSCELTCFTARGVEPMVQIVRFCRNKDEVANKSDMICSAYLATSKTAPQQIGQCLSSDLFLSYA
jgi:hypothetical protein